MCTRGQFVGKSKRPISERYTLTQQVFGEGGCGQVVKATHVHTKKALAVKSMSKERMAQKNEHPTMEGEILKSADHPNIVKLIEIFESPTHVHLVMEICTGGPISERVFTAEPQMASVMFQIFYAVRYLHKNSILHLDLNMQNVLLESSLPLDQNNIKIIDFGSARRGFDFDADILACGHILRGLLSTGPLAKHHQKETNSKAIAVVNKNGAEVHVSAEATDLLRRLKGVPGRMLQAGKILSHAWFTKRLPRSGKSAGMKLLPSVVERFTAFLRCSKLKRAVLHIIADHASVEEIRDIRSLFMSLDRDFDGFLLPKDVMAAISKACGEIPEGVFALMRDLDAEGVGVLEYGAFVAALIDKKIYQKEQACRDAFDTFDRDGNGQVSPEEVANVMCSTAVNGSMEIADLEKHLREDVDQNGDGVISYTEFKAMVQGLGSGSNIWRIVEPASNVMNPVVVSASPLERANVLRVKHLALSNGRLKQKADSDEIKRKQRKERKENEKTERLKRKTPRAATSYVSTREVAPWKARAPGYLPAVKGESKAASRLVFPAFAMKTAETTMATVQGGESVNDVANLDDFEDTFDLEDLEDDAEEEDGDDGPDEECNDVDASELDIGHHEDLPPFQPPCTGRTTLLQ
eukprot:TRINITY_DN20882_c0_g1_i2.p1 TRINITY_DN20882_c0_g1~~TRINITY_DN20882_c0_g1_i2.p1  ORF type:complete len:636 (+),score=134.02 TRINITY_DN20882_c0_g1_i2:79-1986(+)